MFFCIIALNKLQLIKTKQNYYHDDAGFAVRRLKLRLPRYIKNTEYVLLLTKCSYRSVDFKMNSA